MLIWILVAVIGVVSALLLLVKKAYKVNNAGIVLITGASTGIGRHAAEHLARLHPTLLVLAGVRKEQDAASIRALGATNLQPLVVDVAQHESCVSAVLQIKDLMAKTGLPFAALVNNAGINRHLPVEFQPLEDAKGLFNTNVFGVIDLVQLTLPLLRESHGRIIMLSSVSGFIGVPTMGIYSASKFAIEGLSDALRREVAHFGISVSIIEPAFVKTTIAHTTEVISGELVKDPELNSKMRSLYAKFFSANSAAKLERVLRKADTPIVTSTAIEHALLSKYPQTRYPVSNSNGVPSTVLSWIAWLLNDRLNDIVVSKS